MRIPHLRVIILLQTVFHLFPALITRAIPLGFRTTAKQTRSISKFRSPHRGPYRRGPKILHLYGPRVRFEPCATMSSSSEAQPDDLFPEFLAPLFEGDNTVAPRLTPNSEASTSNLNPGEFLKMIMREGFRAKELEGVDPRQMDKGQLEILVISLSKDERHWKLSGELLSWMLRFQTIPHPSVFSRVFTSHFNNASPEHALSLLNTLRELITPPYGIPSIVYTRLIHLCVGVRDYETMDKVWKAMVYDGVVSTVSGYTAAVIGYSHAGNSTSSVNAFMEMKKHGIQPDTIAYTALLKALRKGKKYEAMPDILNIMRASGNPPNSRTHGVVIGSYLDRGSWWGAVGYIKRVGAQDGPNAIPATSYAYIIKALGRARRISEAEELFSEAPSEPFILTAMLQAYKASNEALKALNLLIDMHGEHVGVSTLDCNVVLSALSKSRLDETAWKLFLKMRHKLHHESRDSSPAPGFLSQPKSLWSAQEIPQDFLEAVGGKSQDLIPESPETERESRRREIVESLENLGSIGWEGVGRADGVSYEMMMHMWARRGDFGKVEEIFRELEGFGFPITSHSLCARMKTRVHKGDWTGVKKLFRQAKTMDVDLTIHAYNMMLLALLRQDRYNEALQM
ncbi:hypothetical protein AAMO2058_000629700 [Amorphochlora amoebiformis]